MVGLMDVQNAVGVKAKTRRSKAVTACKDHQVEMLEMVVEVVAPEHLVLSHSNLDTSSYRFEA